MLNIKKNKFVFCETDYYNNININDDVDYISNNDDNVSKSSVSNSVEVEFQESNTSLVKPSDFRGKEDKHYRSVNKYFKTCKSEEVITMINIINKDSDISLRILDWFVTSYADINNIHYNVTNGEDDFNVHIGYKAQLKTYTKKYFDPFRRRSRFNYQCVNNKITYNVVTTVGQLNFFRWAFTNKVVPYVIKYHKEISHAMNVANKEHKKQQKHENKVKITIMKQVDKKPVDNKINYIKQNDKKNETKYDKKALIVYFD